MNISEALRSSWNRRPTSNIAIGSTAIIVILLIAIPLYFKAAIEAFFTSGDKITAEFSRNYGLKANESRVKLSGLDVGVVTDIEETDRNSILVTMKVRRSSLDILGATPSATVEPVTVLGGKYTVDLTPGGGYGPFDDGFIPLTHTHVPVELDRVLEALPGHTRAGLQRMVAQLRQTLDQGASQELRQLVRTAPATLEPAGKVLQGLQGTRPGEDLPAIVSTFHTVAATLTERDGQLTDILNSLRDTSEALGDGGPPLARTFTQLAATLRDSRATVIHLRPTLEKLTDTADRFDPSARKLGSLMRALGPALDELRPMVTDLRPAVANLRPTAQHLAPMSVRARDILEDLHGPVLDRINGPILGVATHPYRGQGPFRQTGGGMQANHTLFQELGYMVTNLDRGSMTQDAQGATLGFQPGFGASSLAPGGVLGKQLSLEDFLKQTGGGR